MGVRNIFSPLTWDPSPSKHPPLHSIPRIPNFVQCTTPSQNFTLCWNIAKWVTVGTGSETSQRRSEWNLQPCFSSSETPRRASHIVILCLAECAVSLASRCLGIWTGSQVPGSGSTLGWERNWGFSSQTRQLSSGRALWGEERDSARLEEAECDKLENHEQAVGVHHNNREPLRMHKIWSNRWECSCQRISSRVRETRNREREGGQGERQRQTYREIMCLGSLFYWTGLGSSDWTVT